MSQNTTRMYESEKDFQTILDLLTRVRPPTHLNELSCQSGHRRESCIGRNRASTRLWFDDGQHVGWAYVDAFNNLRWEIDGQYGERIGAEIVEWGESCIRKKLANGETSTLDASCREDYAERISFLKGHGFCQTQDATIYMMRPLSEPIPEPELPQGFLIRPIEGMDEAEAVASTHRAAFGTEYMTIESRLTIMNTSEYDPSPLTFSTGVCPLQRLNLPTISGDLYGDGTGNAGKNLTGLAAAVPDDPTTGTYGGINRAVWTFWQSKKFSAAADGGGAGAVSSTTIQGYMDALAVQLVRGTDKPDLIVAHNNYYRFYLQSLQAIQRITESGSGMAGAGFASLKYYGAGMGSDVVLDGGIGSSTYNSGSGNANHMWFLNTKYLMFRPHKDRNFVPIGGERQAVNQDAIVKLIGWAGNLTCSGSQFQGVLIA